MRFREIINGSYEPLWRQGARESADKMLKEITTSTSRRAFLAGSGAAMLAVFDEYLEMRRAAALPLFRAGAGTTPTGVTGITNARTGTTYPYLQEALYAMASGDTILLPAGATYQYLGQTRYYAHYLNTNGWRFGAGHPFGTMYLGNSVKYSGYGALYGSADYGTVQGTGAANNGRALLTGPYAVLAADFHVTDTEMFFDPSTPVSNLTDPVAGVTHGDPYETVSALPRYNTNGSSHGGFFSNYTAIHYTGINVANNSITGITVDFPWAGGVALPAGSVVAQGVFNGKALFVNAGENPGFTFTNLEMAYLIDPDPGHTLNAVQSVLCDPDKTQVGSQTWNNCFVHDCQQGSNLMSFAKFSNSGMFFRIFDSIIARNGTWTGQTHNIYTGHIEEVTIDNSYSFASCGGYELKLRAHFNLVSYSQIRGEGQGTVNTTENPGGQTPGGTIDFSDGGLNYLIGNVHQSSRFCGNVHIQYNAEAMDFHSTVRGTANPLQELYLINGTCVGPDNGTGYQTGGGTPYSMCPILAYNNYVLNPALPYLGNVAAGSLPARKYWVQQTLVGATGSGETPASQMWGSEGTYDMFSPNPKIWATINVAANNVLNVTTPPPATGATRWNCYVNYADPRMYWPGSGDPGTTNLFFWDAPRTLPVFQFTSGGETISCTGTLNNGSSQVTGVTGITNVSSLQNFVGMLVWIGGVSTGLYVSSATGATLQLSGTYTGITVTAGTITFGWYFSVGVTYVTALGDSANLAFEESRTFTRDITDSLIPYVDASSTYTQQSDLGPNCAYIGVPPGQKLIINAPPTPGPSYATGVNFWLNPIPYAPWSNMGGKHDTEGGSVSGEFKFGGTTFQIGLTKVTSSPVAFGSIWTSPANVFIKQQQMQRSMFLQNSSPISIGADWTEPTTSPGGIDPYSGLRNDLNPLRNQLQWYKRSCLTGTGALLEGWFAVVPAGGLTSYQETIDLYVEKRNLKGCVSVWRGCAAQPFDTAFKEPALSYNNPIAMQTTAANATLLASFHSATGGTPAGFTSLSTSYPMVAAYKQYASAQSSLSISDGGSAGDNVFVDCLVGASAPPALVGSPITFSSISGDSVTITIPSANAGDVVYMQIVSENRCVTGIGRRSYPFNFGQAAGVSPLITVQNTILANFNPATLSGAVAFDGNTLFADASITKSVDAANITTATNLQANPYNGSSFGVPLWASVFADVTQTDYDFRLAVSSPAKNAASNPGASPHGQDLVPHYQFSWHGKPTDGVPIPTKTARSDVGPALTGSIGALT